MVWSPKVLLSSLHKHTDVKTVLHDEYSIPEESVDHITQKETDDGVQGYKIQFKKEFINRDLICEFCKYNDLYTCEKDQESVDIYRIGSKSDLLLGNIERGSSYNVIMKYFEDDKIRSESTARLVMISDFFSYRNQGDFRFIEN